MPIVVKKKSIGDMNKAIEDCPPKNKSYLQNMPPNLDLVNIDLGMTQYDVKNAGDVDMVDADFDGYGTQIAPLRK